jgi:TonB family protein
MKSLVAIGMLVLAFSLCNLMGRRSANSNSNAAPSGTSTETAPGENSNTAALQPSPGRTTLGTGAPPSTAAAPPGVHTLTANRNSAASVPPPPPKPSAPRAPISAGVLNGKATYLPKPAYPPIARAAHVSGTVNVQVVIDESGKVISANAVSGHPLLQGSAVAAARQAKFSPTVLSGQPVKVTGIIVYNFVEQ